MTDTGWQTSQTRPLCSTDFQGNVTHFPLFPIPAQGPSPQKGSCSHEVDWILLIALSFGPGTLGPGEICKAEHGGRAIYSLCLLRDVTLRNRNSSSLLSPLHHLSDRLV
jgi:hypothetical protein